MSNQIYFKKTPKVIVTFLLSIIILASSLPSLTVFAETVPEGSSAVDYNVGKAYYHSDYNYLNDGNSVFQSITWEEAVYLFEQEGSYLILFGGSWCTNTTAVIDYINEAAKAAGVTTIYNLDFRLDGSRSDTHIRETNGTKKSGASYNYLYGELVTRYLTNLNDWVEYTDDGENALTYTNSEGKDVTVPKVQVPFLFLYNKDNTVNHAGESVSGTKYPIVYGFEKMLYRDVNGGKDLFTEEETQNATTKVTDYTQQLHNAIFDHIGAGEGQYTISSFTDADYIRLAYNERSGQTIFEENEQINIQTVTYRQLEWLLRQDGNYLILFGGAWCGNTQAVIDIINDYAVANDVIVYNFDTKLDGGYAKYKWGYTEEVHIRDNNNVFAKQYVDLINEYLDNIETEYTVESGNYIYYQTDPDNEETKKIANKLQVPYFFAYNKDIADEDGHDIPILAYVEKMYVLDETSKDYIGSDANYADYTTAVFEVFGTYAEKSGITAVNIVTDTNGETDTSEVTNDEESPADKNDEGGDNTLKIIVAVVGIVVVIGVVIFVALGKKKSSDGGEDNGK